MKRQLLLRPLLVQEALLELCEQLELAVVQRAPPGWLACLGGLQMHRLLLPLLQLHLWILLQTSLCVVCMNLVYVECLLGPQCYIPRRLRAGHFRG